MAPPAVTVRVPLIVKAGRVMLALLKFKVKLRRLVSKLVFRLVGSAAEALEFFKLKSRMLLKVPPKVMAPLKLLLPVEPSKISEAALFWVKVIKPAPAA